MAKTGKNQPEKPEEIQPADAPQETAASKYRRRQLERQLGPTQFLDMAPPLTADTLWRGLTRNGEARLLVVRATDAVREATERQNCSEDVAKLAAQLMVAALLVRSTLNPEARLQMYLRHDGPVGQIVVDAWESGGVRTYIKDPTVALADGTPLIGAGLLEVARHQASNRRSWRSAVQLQGENVEDFMMHYLLESEQILSLLRVEVEVNAGKVLSAVGYLVQLMPEGTREDLVQMTANLEAQGSLELGMTTEDPDARLWAEGLMKGFRWDQCAREMVAFECRCSEQRVLNMLATLPHDDLRELSSGTEPLEMTCDFCRMQYRIAPVRVAELLELPS